MRFESCTDERSLIQEPMLYKFVGVHNVIEAAKNICWVKSENSVDHSTVTRRLIKYRSGCKNLSDQASSNWLKTVDAGAVF